LARVNFTPLISSSHHFSNSLSPRETLSTCTDEAARHLIGTAGVARRLGVNSIIGIIGINSIINIDNGGNDEDGRAHGATAVAERASGRPAVRRFDRRRLESR
jgi:hypothetical protein